MAITITGPLIGVDLSRGMLNKAQERNIYQSLITADLAESFKLPELQDKRFDIFFAADVLVYLGDLRPILTACAAAASPSLGAVVAFSTEAIEKEASTDNTSSTASTESQEGPGYHLGASGRYSHSRRYLTSLAQELGWALLALRTETIRQQKGEGLQGHLVVFRIPPQLPSR